MKIMIAGWNSWNSFKLNVSENLIKATTGVLISSGLADLGYQYVVIDDGWQDKQRDKSSGLTWNKTRFPNGIVKLADHIHEQGLKIGIYRYCRCTLSC